MAYERDSYENYEDDDNEEPRSRRRAGSPPHSGMGITSFILAVLSGLWMFVVIVIAGIMEIGGDGFDEESPQAMIVGGLFIAGMVLCLIGGVLGIAGLVQPGRSRVFSVIGLCLNVMIVIGTLLLVVMGLLMG